MLSPEDLWIIAIATLVASACALPGVFLVLRRMAMLGDAISHSVLAGIAIAFMLSGSRNSLVMLIGALIVGLITAILSNFFTKSARVQEDASIGVVFTTFFALGVILISAFAGKIDIDLDCVLYGEIAFAPFDRLLFFDIDIGPKAFWIMLVVFLINLSFVLCFFRKLLIITFDPVLAESLGMNVKRWHYLLMGLVSLSAVSAFESVGAVLVVGMLIIPANAAFLTSRSLSAMLILSIFYGVLSAITGFFISSYYDASISAAIVISAGVILSLLLIYVMLMRVFLVSRSKNAI